MLSAHITKSPDAHVMVVEEGYWHLEIPASSMRAYQLAQLDDHGGLPRDKFPWRPPLAFSLQARVSSQDIPGTWGFGFWNDPFSFLLGGNRTVKRLPTLPNAAWFFHASSENYLTFRDDLPANGFTSAIFSSRRLHPVMLAMTSPALGMTLLPITASLGRKSLRRLIRQDATSLQIDVTQWHTYTIDWKPDRVTFSSDVDMLWSTTVVPSPPLSLVIWIDNQFAALPPSSRLQYGTLLNATSAWLEVRDLNVLG